MILRNKSSFLCSSLCVAQSDMDIGMAGHHFSQQQAPPNQTAPWPDSMMPIDQTAFVNQTRYIKYSKYPMLVFSF